VILNFYLTGTLFFYFLDCLPDISNYFLAVLYVAVLLPSPCLIYIGLCNPVLLRWPLRAVRYAWSLTGAKSRYGALWFERWEDDYSPLFPAWAAMYGTVMFVLLYVGVGP
jgi:hypothetical protein